jgi:hypothetical protein
MSPTVVRVAEALGVARTAVVTAARLEALALLGEGAIAAKSAHAARLGALLDAASRLDAHLALGHGAAEESVCWPEGASPAALGLCPAAVDLPQTRRWSASWEARAASALAEVVALSQRSPLFDAARELAAALLLVTRPLDSAPAPQPAASAHKGVRFAGRGPTQLPIDPLFRPTFSLLQLGRDPTLTGREVDRGPYYWGLALRELAAADLCARCLVEYDGLPLPFYRDLGKQCADEVRHGVFYLSVGLSLLPSFVAEAPPGHPLLPAARDHLERGSGLPVPLEGDLQAVFRDSTLFERLVLMHLDTETPGVGAFREQARSGWAQARPWIADGIEATVHDEASHARIGRRWLEHLCPDREERSRQIEAARALRGFYVFAALAQANGAQLPELLQRRSAVPLLRGAG